MANKRRKLYETLELLSNKLENDTRLDLDPYELDEVRALAQLARTRYWAVASDALLEVEDQYYDHSIPCDGGGEWVGW